MNPHAGKVKLLPELIEKTREARERAAAEAFDLAKVRAAIMAAGKDGFTVCAVGPTLPLNLKETAAAKVLIAWLHGEGFQHAWEQRFVANPRPGGETVFDLLVSWRL